ncbi:MAG TPA: hypothetical protein EYO62_00465, partial [Aquificales bacterium]|nr:hypothetical protein [Aquificales bacterium]
MLIKKIFPSQDIVEIQEELRKLYGNNFVVIEINHIKKYPIPFLPLFGKEYTEVIIEIPEEENEISVSPSNGKRDFKEEL